MTPTDAVSANGGNASVSTPARNANPGRDVPMPQMRQREAPRGPGVPVELDILFKTAGITVTLLAIGSTMGAVSQTTLQIVANLSTVVCGAAGLYYLLKMA